MWSQISQLTGLARDQKAPGWQHPRHPCGVAPRQSPPDTQKERTMVQRRPRGCAGDGEGGEEEVAEAEMLRLVGTLWSPPSSAAAASRKQEITEGNRRQ